MNEEMNVEVNEVEKKEMNPKVKKALLIGGGVVIGFVVSAIATALGGEAIDEDEDFDTDDETEESDEN